MKYLFVVSDVHSYYNEMMYALQKQKFDIDNDNHIFVSCGDLFDRGPDSKKCLDFVNSLPDNRKILIRGNHEDLFAEAQNRKMFFTHDYHNRTIDTFSQLSGFSINDILDNELTLQASFAVVNSNKDLENYFNSLYNYYEVGQYIFVHGWIPSYDREGMPLTASDRLNDKWKSGDWKDAIWSNGMKKWQQGERIVDKTIVCGHWHASWGHTYLHDVGYEWDEVFYEDEPKNEYDYFKPVEYAHFEPFKDDGIIAIDACTAYSGVVNCIKLKVKEAEWRLSTLENTMRE